METKAVQVDRGELSSRAVYEEPSVTLYCGHALEVLRDMPAESVDMVMTSPPYW